MGKLNSVSGTAMTSRIPELDGLRGIAILLVLSFHYVNNQLVNSSHIIGKLVAKVTSFGWVGVDLFFVLSGFLIGSILLRNELSRNFFATFYIRRFVRIVPNYYLLLLVFMLLGEVSSISENHFLSGGREVPIWSYFAMVHNLFMAKLNSLGNDAISVTWSIGIEEQFYILFPVVLYFLSSRYIPHFLVFVIITANLLRLGFEHWIPPYVLLPCRMDAIAMGIGVAWLDQKFGVKEVVVKKYTLLVSLVFFSVLTCGYLYIKYKDIGPVRHSIFALVFSILLMWALSMKDGTFGVILRNKYLMWIGTISYSLYLFHYLILGVFHEVFLNQHGVVINDIRDIAVTISALSFSIIFSWGIYKYMEAPFVRIGKRYKY